MNQVKEGRPIPQEWANGAIVYIYKNKGGQGEFGNYRPICRTKIIYKIWSGLFKIKLTKITHILISNNRYGYKEGISTIDALINAEQYIELEERNAKILLMGLSKALGAIKRTLLWTTLYQKEQTGEMIKRIRRGHQGTGLSPKYKGNMGNLRKQHRGIPRVRNKCDTIHNLHG